MHEYESPILSWHHKEFTDALLADRLDGLRFDYLCTYLVLSSNGRSKSEQARADVPRGLQHVPRLKGYSQFKYLTRLVMNSNEISCIDVENIPVTVQLLDFDQNQIQYMPDFSHLELHTLQIACNSITHINGDYLPQTVATLHLDGNQLTAVPVMPNLVNLQRLYMTYNQIGDLTVNNLPVSSITHMYLHHNKLKNIPNLGGLVSLQVLSLPDKEVQSIQGYPESLIEATLAKNLRKYNKDNPLKYKKVLSLHDNEVKSIRGLPESLIEVTLAGNPLEELGNDCFKSKHLYSVVMKKYTVFFGQGNVLTSSQITDLRYPPGSEVFQCELYYRERGVKSNMSEAEVTEAGYRALMKYFTENILGN